jgi:hypothetical protein
MKACRSVRGVCLCSDLGLVNHAWAVVTICGLLAVVHAGYVVFLLKIGRDGWRRRRARI